MLNLTLLDVVGLAALLIYAAWAGARRLHAAKEARLLETVLLACTALAACYQIRRAFGTGTVESLASPLQSRANEAHRVVFETQILAATLIVFLISSSPLLFLRSRSRFTVEIVAATVIIGIVVVGGFSIGAWYELTAALMLSAAWFGRPSAPENVSNP